MRTYGRVTNEFGTTWVEVDSTPQAGDDYVWITTLCQCLKLNINESPFFANFGINAKQSVIQQIFPDYYVSQTQSQFSGFFASLIITKLNSPTPTYQVNLTTNQGVPLEAEVPV